MAVLIIVAVFLALAIVGGVFGADSRGIDPRYIDPQWPFLRHRS